MNLAPQYREQDERGLAKLADLAHVSRETSERLIVYAQLLRRWQERVNLVSPSSLADVWNRHIIDCAQFFALMPEARRWLDLGTGAGLPGLVIAAFLEEKREGKVILVESQEKKCAFLREAARQMSLGERVEIYGRRIDSVLSGISDADESAPETELKPKPDVICARALAPLDALLRMVAPHLSGAEGASCGLFAKGGNHQKEIDAARKNWDFELVLHKSRTNPQSYVLKVKNVRFKRSNMD